MTRLRLSAALLLTIFVAFGATACDTITGGDDDDITGTYTLQTINGEGLPYVEYEDDEWKYEILGIIVTLSEGGACTVAFSAQETYKPDNTTEDDSETNTCTYTVADSAITITIPEEDGEDEVVTGTISGDTITITVDGDTLVFEK